MLALPTRKLFPSLLFLFAFIAVLPARASHIVGGEFQYTCLNNQVGQDSIRYLISFKLYMDCMYGQPGAIAVEDTGAFSIYDVDDSALVMRANIAAQTKQTVPADFANDCVTNPPTTCLLVYTYNFTVSLRNRANGFYVAINNCCRNETIVNINNPDQTGASYHITLPPRASTPIPGGYNNSSAIFQKLPPQIICMNAPFSYDHSATDADGDSLSYEFGPAFDSKKVIFNGATQLLFSPPPYPPVNYSSGFSPTRPITGNPPLAIDRNTGWLAGTPDVQGRFVVTVYCHEWRNGVLINTISREFQFEITDCSKNYIANIPQHSSDFNTYIANCKNKTVFFENISLNGTAYHWDFGVPGTDVDTSNEFQPTFTYPDTGVYTVKLVVNPDASCSDSIARLVKIFPAFNADFSFTGLPCTNLSFVDASTGVAKPASYWYWSFGDGYDSYDKNPVHGYWRGGPYDVTLISKNEHGCEDTVTQHINIDFMPYADDDTVIVKDESIILHASGGDSYVWTPATNLSGVNAANPVAYFPEIGSFSYIVNIKNNQGCESNDTVNIRVLEHSSMFVPSAFSPNGDGRNDILRPLSIGYKRLNFFRVLNRWGRELFNTAEPGTGWDGTWQGEPQDIGTYYWVLSVINRFDKTEIVKGDCVLLR